MHDSPANMVSFNESHPNVTNSSELHVLGPDLSTAISREDLPIPGLTAPSLMGVPTGDGGSVRVSSPGTMACGAPPTSGTGGTFEALWAAAVALCILVFTPRGRSGARATIDWVAAHAVRATAVTKGSRVLPNQSMLQHHRKNTLRHRALTPDPET